MNHDELNLKVWGEPKFGVYFFEISDSDGVIFSEGTGPSPYVGTDELNNIIQDLGWADANDTR
jgi:hypothetical protein